MDRIKRNERLGAMTRLITEDPNRIHTLSEFCELFGSAKSTISEDIDLIAESLEHFDLGRLETVAGAAGGVRYRPMMSAEKARDAGGRGGEAVRAGTAAARRLSVYLGRFQRPARDRGAGRDSGFEVL